MPSRSRVVLLAGAAALAAMAVVRSAYAQDEDLYFEMVRGARGAACADTGRYVCYDLLSTHHENYFLSGFNGATEVKFQFSVKYNLWPNETPSSVQFGYTQKSTWDLYRPSAPFVETNYNPDIFYTYDFRAHGRALARVPGPEPAPAPAPEPGRGAGAAATDDARPHEDAASERGVRCSASFLRGGFQHESNGLGGATSRGWNRVYGEGLGACELGPLAYVTADLVAWLPPFGDGNNPDISSYLGSGDLTVAVGVSSDDGWGAAEVAASVKKGWRAALGVGGLEVDARWRPGYASMSSAWRFVPYFFGQMYTGYGETLLDYDNPETSFRLGVGLSGSVRWRKAN